MTKEEYEENVGRLIEDYESCAKCEFCKKCRKFNTETKEWEYFNICIALAEEDGECLYIHDINLGLCEMFTERRENET